MMDACPKPAMLCKDKLRIMVCNPQAVDLLGLSLDRLIREQRRLDELVTAVAGGAPTVSSSLRDEAERLAALFGGAAGTEVTVRHHSGAQGRAVMSMSRVRDMSGERTLFYEGLSEGRG
jgi:PAS domain-containing protein